MLAGGLKVIDEVMAVDIVYRDFNKPHGGLIQEIKMH